MAEISATKMSKSEWNRAIDEHLEEQEKNKGTVKPVPIHQHTDIYSFPVAHRVINEDLIHLHANAVGDPNPLYHDPTYGRGTRWGSMIAPPIFETCIAESPALGIQPQVPGWNLYAGGTSREYFKPIRPGDEFHCVDKSLGLIEKSKPDKPYRLFMLSAQRSYINQKDEVACNLIMRCMCTATPPGGKEQAQRAMFKDKKRHRFTNEELEVIHGAYDEELEGKWRRGAETRYWEDVTEGEEIHPVCKGPYDITDSVSMFGATGYSSAFAIKWQGLKTDMARNIIDPETGEYHGVLDWHFWDSIAQQVGLPYAHAFGTHIEMMLAHGVCNWMGDDGWVTKMETQLRSPLFYGDMCWVKGKVKKKYKNNNERLVDLEVWAENQDGVNLSPGIVTVRLPSREE